MQTHHKVILSILIITSSFIAGWWMHQPAASTATEAVRTPLYYQCPMHPAYKSDKPGDAPCCGMKLVPVYAEDAGKPGTVRINLDKQQVMGLTTSKVARTSGTHTIRVLGRVAADETRVHRVAALADGVVRLVSPFAVGNVVGKDALLARYFVSLPEVYSAMQSYFVAMTALEQGLALRGDDQIVKQAKAQARLSQELLQTYGLSETQLKEMARTRQATRDIEFRSPVDGLVLARNVGLGQRLAKGDELFRIADLSRMWVLADLFENEAGLVRTGAKARVLYQGRSCPAAVAEARQFDPASRTLKVRLELANPGLVLRPDMFVDVELDVPAPQGISVPVDALVDSGRRKAVFVATGPGEFEPREVTAGTRYGGRVQILSGLEEGEMVVISGLFLLDSESRLQVAAAASAKQPAPSAAAGTDPVCGMEVEPSASALRSDFEGEAYYFCSRDCKKQFDGRPSHFASKKQGKGGQS